MTKKIKPHASKFPDSPNAPVVSTFKMLVQVATDVVVPGGGTVVGWVLDSVLPDPGKAAMEKFLLGLAEKVEQLGIDQEEIKASIRPPEGRALLTYSLGIAARSFGPKKFAALENATVRGVFHHPDNIDLTAIVFAALDRLTDGHITMLQAIRQHELNTNPVAWKDVKKVGLQLSETSDGMRDPQPATRPGDSKSYYVEGRHILANQILIADLVNLGLLDEAFAPMPPTIYEYSTNAEENLPSTAKVTAKGLLTLEHISEIHPLKSD